VRHPVVVKKSTKHGQVYNYDEQSIAKHSVVM